MLVSMWALVIGDSGQDGQILSLRLRSLGLDVLGVSRSRTLVNDHSQEPVYLSDQKICDEFLSKYEPQVIFHVAAVHGSSNLQETIISQHRQEMYACHVEITKNVLRWIELKSQTSKFHLALSSQMYSPKYTDFLVDELTETNPSNYYGQTKVEAWALVKLFREQHSLSANASILFNHASIFSKNDFVFSFLAEQFSHVINKESDQIYLRDPWASIDVSWAFEVCDAMLSSIRIAPQEDFVFASGTNRELNEIVQNTLLRFGLNKSCLTWDSKMQTSGLTSKNSLIANPHKAKSLLGWNTELSPEDILETMVLHKLSK